MLPNQAARARRKPAPGDKEKVKHRRTRSGCFTCRARRVKCDEKRPTCDRCRKGDRECSYPENSSSSKASTSKPSSKHGSGATSPRESSSSGEEYEDFEIDLQNSTIDEFPEAQDGARFLPSGRHRKGSDTPPLVADQSATPSTEGSAAYAASRSGSSISHFLPSQNAGTSSPREGSGKIDWSHLPSDIQFYLNYHQTQVTPMHYSFRHDATSFLRTTLLDLAVQNEPLLYAVVGFAAFHHTLRQADGKIQDFLGFYNKSVSLLRRSLSKHQKHTTATLLTILQLASIEEYLGDWVNLLSHQKASYEILTELYNPRSILRSRSEIITLTWYTRFDLFAGLMGGWQTTLSREWFEELQQHQVRQIRLYPENLTHKIEECSVRTRLLAIDMSGVFGKLAKGNISLEEFKKQNEELARQYVSWRQTLHPGLTDEKYTVQNFENARPLNLSDIVNPYVPGTLFEGPLWPMNFVLLDWKASMVMHKYQTALALRQNPPPELGNLALEICQVFEAVQCHPDSPQGSLLTLQASLGIASLFLPKDHRHTMWCRRKFATIENLGYIYPPTFRSKMAALWAIPEIQHWWLPNDENYPPIIRSIRAFVEERTRKPSNETASDLRDIKTIFGSMKISDDSPTPPSLTDFESPASSGEGKTHVAPSLTMEMSDRGTQNPAFMASSDSPEYWDASQLGDAQGRY
ncbi:MAG: Vacuolar-sorting protein SNF7 [Chaenotheca gracillima]|nr:MAG: Vacuolar-sorting protein SNF7 [Chaenotheca gracillima]